MNDEPKPYLLWLSGREKIMKRILHTYLVSLLVLAAPAGALLAHGGEDHGEAAAVPAVASGAESDLLTTFGATERYELLLKYPAPAVKSPARLRIYLSDYQSNRPVSGASFVLASRPSGVTAAEPPRMLSPGIYEMAVIFPRDTVYTLTATIAAEGAADAVVLENVYAGEAAEHFLEDHGQGGAAEGGSGSSFPWLIAGIATALVIAIIAVAIIFLVKRRASNGATATTLSQHDLSTQPMEIDNEKES